MKEKPPERLRLLARAAIVQTKGDHDRAFEAFDAKLVQQNDAELERELTKEWRKLAIRSLLAVHFNELRSEGKISRSQPEAPIRTQRWEEPTEPIGPKTWADQRIEKMEDKKRNRLAETIVNGKTLADSTREEVLDRADHDERHARFLRLCAEGVPPNGKIGDFKTASDADQAWEIAQRPVERKIFEIPDPDANWAFQKIFKPARLKDRADFDRAQTRATALLALPSLTEVQSFELDCLARFVKENEATFR